MKQNRSLKLPYQAAKVIPDDVQRLLPSSPLPMLTDEPRVNNKPTSATRSAG
jgi:hypothetical protein